MPKLQYLTGVWILDRCDEPTKLIAHGLRCHTSGSCFEVDMARAANARADRVAGGHQRAAHGSSGVGESVCEMEVEKEMK